MKTPRYMDVTYMTDKDKIVCKIRIKKWGIPILVYRAMKVYPDFKWYLWIFYPYLCFKALTKGL